MMKTKKIKVFLLSCLVFLATTLCSALLTATIAPKVAKAEGTLSATEFKTDGASVRVFKKTSNGTYEDATDRQGLRFHVEMGEDYAYEGMKIVPDLTQVNETNGSYKVDPSFKTYTLIIPTRLLSGDLTVNTEKVMKLDTTGYWYSDKNSNLESVAYVYNIPSHRYTDYYSYRGIICKVAEDGTETVVASSDVAKRRLAEIAKYAYMDTIDGNTTYWGSAEMDEAAAPLIKKFIPTYTVAYNINGTVTTEDVLWGDKPQNIPEFNVSNSGNIKHSAAWYDTTNNEEVDLTAVMDWSENRTLTLTASTSAGFTLTGAEDYNNFTYDNTNYNGVKLYATLPAGDFYTQTEIAEGSSKMVEIDVKAVNVEYQGSASFKGLQGVWVKMEGRGKDAQIRLVFAFDSANWSSGDKLIVKGDSVFYANGVMYKLTEDYTIDYTVVNGTENYGIFLGYIHNFDVKKIESWIEPTDVNRKRIRVTFYNNLLINSDFIIVYDGTLPEGYAYPVYTRCAETDTKTEITQGYYYWNEGENTILELSGYESHNQDELYGAPGTKIVQNGGYYIFEDEMYAYYNGNAWVVGEEKGTFGADAFESRGWHATDTTEVRFTTNSNTALTAGGTTDHWFDDVVQLTGENMSGTEPYAVYWTAVDGTKTEIDTFMYHGQYFDKANPSGGYNHVFAFKNYKGTEAGETITIAKGARFWGGSEYYTATEKIVFYYNGSYWTVGNDGTADDTITITAFSGKNYEYSEAKNSIRMHFTEEYFGGQSGYLYIESGSVKINGKNYTNLYYYGNGNMIFEIKGDGTTTLGVNAFEDTLVIEKGTRLWLGASCLEFGEQMEWRYLGGSHSAHKLMDLKGSNVIADWVNVNANTEITCADILGLNNATDAGGEVRLTLAGGILTSSYYGWGAVDTSKGIPVVNGVKMTDGKAFFFGSEFNLIAVRGGEYGTKLGDYIVIPKGSVWWTPQGSFTFTEEIRGVYNGSVWLFGFNAETYLGAIDSAAVESVRNEGNNEIRVQIPLGVSDTYYGETAIDGDVTLEKIDGTRIVSTFSRWYGGASGTYTANHSLIGVSAVGIAGATNGDLFTVKSGTKIIFNTNKGVTGYRTVDGDIVYTYVDGAWKAGNLRGTVTIDTYKATVSGLENLIVGKSYTFTVTPVDGYVVSSVTVNGKEIFEVGSNSYTFTAEKENVIKVMTITTASAVTVSFSVDEGVKINGGTLINGATVHVINGNSYTFSIEVESGYRLVGVDGMGLVDNGNGTYTIEPRDNVTITITTKKQYTVTYTLNQATASVGNATVTSGASMTVDAGEYVVSVKANVGYSITTVSNATNNLDGTYTVNVDADMNVVVSTKQSVKFDAGIISAINPYDETKATGDARSTGVRFSMNEAAYPDFEKITAVYYDLDWNGSVTATVDGGVYYATVFGADHNLFELRFATANLKAGDTFTIKAGTVFSHNNCAYAIEFTEDIVGYWTGSFWALNPTKIGELDWNKVSNVKSHSDFKDGTASNYTIRIFLSEELFGGATGQAGAVGNITINGNPYTGSWKYHGSGNKIVELSEWSYAKDQKLVIEAGTKIFFGSSYYITTNTLTATCTDNGSGAKWEFKVS